MNPSACTPSGGSASPAPRQAGGWLARAIGALLVMLTSMLAVPVVQAQAQAQAQTQAQAPAASTAVVVMPATASAHDAPPALSDAELIARTRYWVDPQGQASLAQVLALPDSAFASMERHRAFELPHGALWLRLDLPTLDPQRRWHLRLQGPAYTNQADFHQRDAEGRWRVQRAGDHLPMSQWTQRDLVPTFEIAPGGGQTVLLRIENQPTSINPGLSLIDEAALHALRDRSRRVYRFAWAWSAFGLMYPVIYALLMSPAAFKVLNLYGFLSVLLSMGLCIWAWRKGEVYAGWTALGFAPLHLAYPFAALRAAGVLGDSWITQYAILIGSAIEIPLLLYILHRRARDFSEIRARLRALDTTEPLTGLPMVPVLLLRLGDSLRRARHDRSECGMALIELANHAELAEAGGREQVDRALVVTASLLTRVARPIDTVCRVGEHRFAVLFEAPHRPERLKLFAQHVVARGLAQADDAPGALALKFRVVTIALPDHGLSEPPAEERDVRRLLDRLGTALERLDASRTVLHLPLQRRNPGPSSQP